MTRAVNETLLDFERTLLASMMLRPADCWRVDAQPDHFISEQHGDVLTAIRSLSQDSKSVDPVSVCDYFESIGKRHLGALAIAIGNAMTTATPDAYSHRIISGWRQRRARDIGSALVASNDPGAVDSAIAELMALHATEQKHEFTAKEAARDAFTELNRIYDAGGKLPGVTTGLADLDDKLGGFHAGDLIVIGGRTAMGKTALLLGMARAAAKSGVPVGMVSGEQPAGQVMQRMVSAASNLPAKTFRTAQFDDAGWGKVFGGFSEVAALPLWMLDRSSPTLAEVVRVSRRWVHQHGIMAVYIDYLQRIRCEGCGSRREEVAEVARGLKNLARDLNIPVIALAQVNRSGANADSVPQIIHFADADEIGRESDVAIMVHRAGYYDDSAPQGVAQIVVEKNRHGPTGATEVSWAGETMTFRDLSHRETACAL